MKVYGLSMIRNEADIIRLNVLYHLSTGFDRMLVVDNGSTDGTDRVLQRLAEEEPRLRWSRDESPAFKQGEIFTGLARDAHGEGADWIVPVDADDFWHARGGDLRRVLAGTDAVALKVNTIDFIQRREQLQSSPDALLHMTRRIEHPVERDRALELMQEGEVSYIEMERVPRWISRPSADTKMVRGAHKVSGTEGPQQETEEIVCLHAPLRSYAALQSKAESAVRRGQKSGSGGFGPGWHVSRWQRLRDEGRLEEEWAANSYSDGGLDVYGSPHPAIFDPTLRDALRPLFDKKPLWKRLLGRR